jgi:glutamate-1-semialdehyde 2,1-aminomutase
VTADFRRSNELRLLAHRLIPGGCHTYAKGDDQYPSLAPGFISRGSGSKVWDVDGNRYIEYGMGNRAVGLGHAYPSVIKAARDELRRGCNFTRPAEIEIRCAAQFLELLSSAEMVKFCKDGSDATSAAVRLARAYTGRDLIACCADQPFFSTDDWFIGTTSMNSGIPQAVRDLTLQFRYNDIESATELFAANPNTIAALILEAARLDEPKDGYLQKLLQLCHEHGALLILDEMITGFRWHNGGAQQVYNIVPDLSCFGKALGNGFSVSALAGKRDIMSLGGLQQTGRPRVFLLSTTHGAETHALAAAFATMKIYAQEPVIGRLYELGTRLAEGFAQVVNRHGLRNSVRIHGRPCCLLYSTCDHVGVPSQAFRSLFLQELIAHGILAPSFVVSYSHTVEDIDLTLDAVDAALAVYKRALEDGVERYLVGPPSEPVFRRFNRSTTENFERHQPRTQRTTSSRRLGSAA